MEENIILEAPQEQPQEEAPVEKVPQLPTQEEEMDTIAAHVAEMREKFPQVDIIRLEQNPAFRRFVGSRYGKESLAQLYEDFSTLMGEAEKVASAKAEARRSRDTGGSGAGKSAGALSGGEREALRRWNESNPDMKMSEKEFLERG